MTFGERLVKSRQEAGYNQKQFAQALEITPTRLNYWEKNKRQPDVEMIERISAMLNISADYLIGRKDHPHPALPSNIIPMPKMKKVPIIGEIACGEPIYADERYGEFANVDMNVNCDFALMAKGDSMIDVGIEDGYVVFIRQQDTVDDGEIAAVILDDEATLKRVRRAPGNTVMLEACNSKYEPIFIGGPDETRVVRILGKAVAFQGFL